MPEYAYLISIHDETVELTRLLHIHLRYTIPQRHSFIMVKHYLEITELKFCILFDRFRGFRCDMWSLKQSFRCCLFMNLQLPHFSTCHRSHTLTANCFHFKVNYASNGGKFCREFGTEFHVKNRISIQYTLYIIAEGSSGHQARITVLHNAGRGSLSQLIKSKCLKLRQKFLGIRYPIVCEKKTQQYAHCIPQDINSKHQSKA